MSTPQESNDSPPKQASQNVPYRDAPQSRAQPQNIEVAPHTGKPSYNSTRNADQPAYRYNKSLSSRLPTGNPDPEMTSGGTTIDVNRKRSLVRPERGRIDGDHPNFHYRQHAQNMDVLPSSTGTDPILEDHDGTGTLKFNEKGVTSGDGAELDPNPSFTLGESQDLLSVIGIGNERLQPEAEKKQGDLMYKKGEGRQKELDDVKPLDIWNVYCALITFWCPSIVLHYLGKTARAQRRAWREKMGLISIILLIAAFVGFLTFGFTKSICPLQAPSMKVNHINGGYMIFHGKAYPLYRWNHPAAIGIREGSNVVYDLPTHYGGMDGSFMFQNVNGACKDLITLTPTSDVPTNTARELAWYFPCTAFNQDGSSQPNLTVPYYFGYSCHTSFKSRAMFFDLPSSGDVAFTWEDVKNRSRNLMIYSGNVLDLDLLRWFNKSQVAYPPEFDQLRANPAVRGVDVTYAFVSSDRKQLGQCLSEIIRVGSIDTKTIGCLASQVVLYVSLVFILAIVSLKFLLAVMFHWFFSRRFAASNTLRDRNPKLRAQEIEAWTDSMHQLPPRMTDSSTAISDEKSKRHSRFLPTTSRFTSSYASTTHSRKHYVPTTMASQKFAAKSRPPTSPYQYDIFSELIPPCSDTRPCIVERRSSMSMSGQDQLRSTEIKAPEMSSRDLRNMTVVPQPSIEWEPFGYPLAHVICLITAYSEGRDGLRTTLDSIAQTEYPNSHKMMFLVCDGLVKGAGEDLTTPEIVLSMIKDHAFLPDKVQAFSYVAVASGSKRHNMAKVYSGFYDYGEDSRVPLNEQQRVPILVVVKCGTPDEAQDRKPGNRGKRDSQVILMSLLQKVMFDERMTELEFELFNNLWSVTGVSPEFYEIVLMVDADTNIYTDSLTHMVSAMVKDPQLMGLCGETKIANKRASWVTMIQVFEYFISHNLSKSFESVFGACTCLPGCFCMYRIKAPKGGGNYWVPLLANPDVVEHYSETVVDTLHKKNLLLLGEDRYLSGLMLRIFPKRKQVYMPQAICKTVAPEQFSVLLSQRRRWINSTMHNLLELLLVKDLCGMFCFSMRFVIFIELVGTSVLPAAISFTFYLIISAILSSPAIVPLVLLALILGLPAVLIVLTAHHWSYVFWMSVYLVSLPIWNFVLPVYAYWKFDDFSWGDTRKTAGEQTKTAGIEYKGEFDSRKITMKRWAEFEKERRLNAASTGWS
ncbi:hypothetical protein N7G274_010471 [Stereocaulon virgatum]|uniref:chitin synthase n=1 Tax=Stereocaulon virgatum TaxID=373712 RepID=A0ABR3ZVN8_9LECA